MTESAPQVDRRTISPRLTRLGAWLVDILVCAVLVATTQQVLSADWDEPVASIPAFVYFWLLHARFGRTLGKWLAGIKVVARGTDRPPSLWAAAVRSLWVFLTAIPAVGWVVGMADWLWSFFDGEKRCLHDLLAGTVVVNAQAKD
ncbi:putative RDD family membrane protein YckC [Nonomuraea thailandensis]|uniref:RDD family membrane protein YckC n=1 Tax=Nonomuraea thailandensis TaxID=1188745 RepID=A0A9X2GV13_9ACTN|nr:RDD family protein [Nonomuraea thailandensis]MCP2362251.1 putative RDD family membrane protein YckC [Nonomuraea thailandensis]